MQLVRDLNWYGQNNKTMKKTLTILLIFLVVFTFGQQSFKAIKVNNATQTISMALSDGDEVVNIDGDTTWRITAYIVGGGTLADITDKELVGSGGEWSKGDGTNTIYQNGITPGKTTENNLVIFDRAKHVSPFDVTSDFVDFYSTWRSSDSVLTASPMRYEKMEDLKADTGRPVIAYLSGYYTENDGGGGYFLLDSASTDTDNGGTIIKQDDYTNGRYLRFPQDGYYVEQFGIRPAITDSATFNSRIIDSIMIQYNWPTLFNADEYFVDMLNFVGEVPRLIGTPATAGTANAKKTVLRYKGERDSIFVKLGGSTFESFSESNLSTSKGIILKNLELYGHATGELDSVGIDIRGINKSQIENINIEGFDIGIILDYTWIMEFNDIEISNANDTAIIIGNRILETGQNGVVFNNLSIGGIDLSCAVYTKQINSVTFNNLIIDNIRETTISMSPKFLGGLTFNYPHFEDSTKTMFEFQTDSTTDPNGSLRVSGGRIGLQAYYNGTTDTTKLFGYTSQDSNAIANVYLNTHLHTGGAPRNYNDSLFDASGILRLDMTNVLSGSFIDSVNMPTVTGFGTRVPVAFQEHTYYNYDQNKELYTSITEADTTAWGAGGTSNIDDGTQAGQLNYWDGSKWTYADTSNLYWDATNKRVGIGTSIPASAFSTIGSSSTSTDYAVTLEREFTSTASGVRVLALNATTTGDMADNFGGLLHFNIEDNAGVLNNVASMSWHRDGADNQGEYRFWVYNGAAWIKPLVLDHTGVVDTYSDLNVGADLYVIGDFESKSIIDNGSVEINAAYTLPTADGSANQGIVTDAAGNLTFSSHVGDEFAYLTNNIPVSGVTSTDLTWLGEARTHASGQTADYATDFACNNQHGVLNVTALVGTATVTFTGVSMSESSGIPTAAITEAITVDATGRYQTDTKWLEVTNIAWVGGTSKTYDVEVIGYIDAQNRDFSIEGMRVDMTSGGVNSDILIEIIKVQDDGAGKMSLVVMEALGVDAATNTYVDEKRTAGNDRSYTTSSAMWSTGQNFCLKQGDYSSFFSSDENVFEGSTKAEGYIIQLSGTGGGNINNVDMLNLAIILKFIP
jgi:hypothetical protein